MADLSVECSSCYESTPVKTSATITKRGESFNINRHAVPRRQEAVMKGSFHFAAS